MKAPLIVLAAVAAAVSLPGTAGAADVPTDHAHVGEVRTFAVTPDNRQTVDALHRDGWIEANGELLPVRDFDDLYRAIGRSWTAAGVSEDRFAVPALRDARQRASYWDNPYGVLSAADLVTSGRPQRRTSRPNQLSYWIFAGRDVTQAVPAAN